MAISRRLRFEILRRDGHACRYCGAMAPDVPLTVDHVIPTTLGGSDEPANLVTSCQPCNAGKSSIAPDSPIVENVEATALRYKRALEQAVELKRMERDVIDAQVAQFVAVWDDWHLIGVLDDDGKEKPVPLPDNWRTSVERFFATGLTIEDLKRFVETAMMKRGLNSAATWRYFCGCCWRHVTDLQEQARRILESEDNGSH